MSLAPSKQKVIKAPLSQPMFSPLLRWLAAAISGLNIGSSPGAGEQDHTAAVEVLGVLPVLSAALLASMIEGSCIFFNAAAAWCLGSFELLLAARCGAVSGPLTISLQQCPCPALLSYRSSAGVSLELVIMDGQGGEGRAEGWDTSSCWGERLAAAQLLWEEVCVGKEVGTWHLWGHGGVLLLGKHRKLKDAPSVLYPSDSTLSPLDVRKKMIKELKCFYL